MMPTCSLAKPVATSVRWSSQSPTGRAPQAQVEAGVDAGRSSRRTILLACVSFHRSAARGTPALPEPCGAPDHPARRALASQDRRGSASTAQTPRRRRTPLDLGPSPSVFRVVSLSCALAAFFVVFIRHLPHKGRRRGGTVQSTQRRRCTGRPQQGRSSQADPGGRRPPGRRGWTARSR